MEAFAPSEAPKEEEAIKASGNGTPLGDIDFIKDQIDKKPSADSTLTRLHTLCWGKAGQKTMRKKNLRTFNGFDSSAGNQKKVDSMTENKKVTLGDLKDVCGVLGLEKGGTKEEVAKRVVDFLAEPTGSSVKRGGKAPPKKRKAKSAPAKKSKKGKKVKSDKPKRAPSAYMIFCKAERPKD